MNWLWSWLSLCWLTFILLTWEVNISFVCFVCKAVILSACKTNAGLCPSAGEISTKGLVVPMKKEIYGPVLARLREEGLNFMSKSTFQ